MFKKLFGKQQEPSDAPKAPEIIGLRLGGVFELDTLKLRVIEPDLIIEGAAPTQFIQAVGVVKLDENTTVLRYYTDDDGFIQIMLEGGMEESHITDVKLWYYYSTTAVSSDQDWNNLLESQISNPEAQCEEEIFKRVWGALSDDSPPVAMTENTYTSGGEYSETDQFIMLYERELNNDLFEYLMISGEEKVINGMLDHVKVVSTGFDLQPTDLKVIG